MLAPPSDFGYSPTHAAGAAYHHQQQQAQSAVHMPVQQHQHSDERPKLFGLEPAHSAAMSGMTMMGVHEYHHQLVHAGTPHHHHHTAAMTPHAAMTPQHAAAMTPQHATQAVMTPHGAPVEYDHEPIVMNVAPAAHYYAPMGTHMLLVSSDYDYNSAATSADGATPKNKPGTKRSREDLNLKEKKRMFKLNDRINQLKDMLEDAGVQTKKNKQSILDNAAYFIEQLRSDLMIAKQKAERAEKEAELLKAQAGSTGGGDSRNVFTGCFQQSVTPRVVLDLHLKPVTINPAFLSYAGRDNKFLMKKDNLNGFLCTDNAKLQSIVKKVCDENKPATMSVEAKSARGVAPVVLIVSAVSNTSGKAINVEISVIPTEVASKASATKVKKTPMPAPMKAAEPATDSDTSVESIVV